MANGMSPEAVADSKDLPLAAVSEAIEYCETNRELLEREAKAERLYSEERGVILATYRLLINEDQDKVL